MKYSTTVYIALLMASSSANGFVNLSQSQSHNRIINGQDSRAISSLCDVCMSTVPSGLHPQASSSSRSSSRSSPRSSQLMAFYNDNQDDNIDEDDNDDFEEDDDQIEEPLMTSQQKEHLERARQRFEEMMSMPKDNQKSSDEKDPKSNDAALQNDHQNEPNSKAQSDSDNPDAQRDILATRTISKALLSHRASPPPLTAILRERRLKEIQLLSTLTTSDDAINELWALWIAERGAEAASHLLHAEELMSVESWGEAEELLLSLIDEHGIHWAEPVNRLATLYYMQGRVEESRALCEIVLDTKPWHFGALSGIVLVCTAMNDATGARMWATRRLPPLLLEHGGMSVGGERRSTWTERAIDDATESLRKASLVGRSKSIGVEEVQFRNFRAKLEKDLNMDLDGDGSSQSSSWQ
eukprot:CAMPEP_0197246922 /NCGR_PEP_ID=MMETSP1429-20130617/23538_1 /TAXON_ID=49237 /ORGANISM="Chaetoceros  sp., Strain UNC1202" /LENGTH=410 /DNA_ID=CAMNT_0042707699 /DNA_START=284 /DNA_END=1516 /DNA_ORIENTATION=+